MKLGVTEESLSLVPPSLPYTSPTTSITPALAFTKPTSVKPRADIAHVPTLMEASQFLGETASSSIDFLPTTLLETDSFASLLNGNNDPGMQKSLSNTNEISFASFGSVDGFTENTPPVQPERVEYPTPPRRVDTSFMLPDMVLVPADISALREQNPKVQITPDQWRVLTCVDGRNSLQMTCQLLGLPPDVVCLLVGELVAEGLIYVMPPEQVNILEAANTSHDLSLPDLTNAYVAPGYTANAVSPWSAAVPALSSTSAIPIPSAALSFETESQWGNGGNGATFIPGRGWVTTPQSMQPLHSQGPLTSPQAVYAQVGR
jgi:hypothetical protein